MIDIGLPHVLLSLLLCAVALAVTLWWKIPVQKDIALGSVRAFVQLIAVGYVLEYIFGMESIWLILLAILIMITVGAHAAAGRATGVRGAFRVTFPAIIIGSTFTLGLMLLVRIVPFKAQYIIPLAGMIVGNSMNASALTVNRIAADLKANAPAIETALALGKGWREASRPYQKNAATAGMLSILNFMKTVGIVALPGAMTGMILAGADPLKAVLFQIVVGYMLMGAVSIASVVALELTIRRFFTRCHQLVQEQI